MNAYRTDTLELNGRTYKAQWFYDEGMGAPWEEHDGHGPVSDWTRRDKKPGELVLSEDRGMRRFYDFQQAIAQAKTEGWNTEPYNWPTKGAQAQAAVLADFNHLRDWCLDRWHWCGIKVTLLDDDGNETDKDESLWGIDETHGTQPYHFEVIAGLIAQIENDIARNTYPVTEVAL
mgnify:CR=1 FL=1